VLISDISFINPGALTNKKAQSCTPDVNSYAVRGMMCPMQGAAQGSVCPKCGSTETGSLFCKNCGATLRQPVPLIPSYPSDFSQPSIGIWKRILRGIVKAIAAVAGIVLIFDNRASGADGIALLASVGVSFCAFSSGGFLISAMMAGSGRGKATNSSPTLTGF
jgi:hypothetical protein